MTNKEKTTVGSMISVPVISILLGIAATAITQNMYTGLAIFIISMVYMLTDVIGLIPFVGVFVQYHVLTNYIIPFMTSTFMVPQEVMVLLSIAFYLSIIFGGLICVLTTVITLAGVYTLITNN
ncbi:MAG: hypothetical protein PHU51_03675 [Candidatus Nanoarchaeia archaeon]|nr:hypothetical protein [Candidatus Nanoarchaeia archaeon]